METVTGCPDREWGSPPPWRWRRPSPPRPQTRAKSPSARSRSARPPPRAGRYFGAALDLERPRRTGLSRARGAGADQRHARERDEVEVGPAAARGVPTGRAPMPSSPSPRPTGKRSAATPSSGIRNCRPGSSRVNSPHKNSFDLMLAHIATEAGRYRGAIYAWDVVNEPFADAALAEIDLVGGDGSRLCRDRASRGPRGGSRRQLYINDYGVETDGPKCARSMTSSPALKRDGVPIDGVGLQSHFVAGSTPADLPRGDGEVRLARRRCRGDGARSPNPPAGRQALASHAGRRLCFRSSAPAARRPAASASPFGESRTTAPGFPSFFSGYGAALPFDEAHRPKPAVAAMIEAWTALAMIGVAMLTP